MAERGAGEGGLEQEIAALKQAVGETDDSYVLALAANVLCRRGDKDDARRLLDRLGKQQDATGAVQGAKTSITRSGGVGLTVETTALATLAWLRTGEHTKNVEAAIAKELALLGDSGEFEIFEFMRRFGHRVGLASWGGVTDEATRFLPALCSALDALDSSESFVHPDRAIRTVLSGKREEKMALAELESIYREIIALRESAPPPAPKIGYRLPSSPTNQAMFSMTPLTSMLI